MLETERLILTVATLNDALPMMEMNADPDVIRYVGDPPQHNLSEAEQVIRERLLPQWEKYKMGRFTVRLKDGTYIGWCGLRFFPDQNEVDLGYRFAKKFWGKGYATESSRAVLKYGFETLKLKSIIAKAMPGNVESIKVMQKLKMTYKGYKALPDDPHPHVIYEMTLDEFNTCAIS